MANKNIPQIRFKGFDGEWRLLVLGAYSEIYRGGSPRPIDAYLTTSSNGINWIKIGDVNKESKYITTTQERIIEEGVINSRKVYAGDLILSNSMSFGRPYILGINGCIHDGWLVIQNYHNIFDKEYLYYSLAIPSVLNQYKKMAAGSSVKNLNKDIVSEVVLPVPSSKCEQTRIASLFTAIDKQISCSEAKLEKLRTVKKTLLKKMFASQGEKTPQIRFKGFEGEWEEKKFTEVFDIYSNYAFSRSQLNDTNGKIKNIHYGDILIKYGSILNVRREDIPFLSPDINVQTTTQNFVKDGDIIIADAAEDSAVGKCVEIINSEKFSILSGLHTIPCRPRIQFANGFLGHYMNASAYHSTLFQIMQGTKVSSISKKAISKTKLHYTPNVSEQTRIASLFTSLDKQISLQEQKIEKLKAVKKTLLKKMFV